jgi:hypothetical protein
VRLMRKRIVKALYAISVQYSKRRSVLITRTVEQSIVILVNQDVPGTVYCCQRSPVVVTVSVPQCCCCWLMLESTMAQQVNQGSVKNDETEKVNKAR